jgi:hypothetical protein
MKVANEQNMHAQIVIEASSCNHKPTDIYLPDLTNHCKCECGWQSDPYYDDSQSAFVDWLRHIALLHQAGILEIPLAEKYVYAPQHLALIISGEMSVVASAGERWKQKHAE